MSYIIFGVIDSPQKQSNKKCKVRVTITLRCEHNIDLELFVRFELTTFNHKFINSPLALNSQRSFK